MVLGSGQLPEAGTQLFINQTASTHILDQIKEYYSGRPNLLYDTISPLGKVFNALFVFCGRLSSLGLDLIEFVVNGFPQKMSFAFYVGRRYQHHAAQQSIDVPYQVPRIYILTIESQQKNLKPIHSFLWSRL
jgi:hypothetical protein